MIGFTIKKVTHTNQKNLRCNNKGVALVACLLVLIPLMILSSVFFARSISEKNLIQIQQQHTQAFYLAQRGLTYAYFEIAHHPFVDWVTHEVQGNDNSYTLIPSQNAPPVFLQMCQIDASGNYVPVNVNASGDFTVRVYPDPFKRDESIILSKGTFQTNSFILAQRINTASLYKYFIFTPDNLILDNATYDGGGLRRWIHTNGDAVFRENVVMTNMDRFDTAGAFRYDYIAYVPPDPWPGAILGSTYNSWGGDDLAPEPISNSTPAVYWQYRWPWYEPFPLGGPIYPVDSLSGGGSPPYTNQHYYYNNPDGHLYGDSWIPQQQEPNIQAPPPPPADLRAIVNNVRIPNRFQPGFSYPVNKYLPLPEEAELAGCQPEPDPPTTIDITYLNSLEQPVRWRNFLNQSGLDGVLNDSNTGVEQRVPFQLNFYKFASGDDGYIDEAGLYINWAGTWAQGPVIQVSLNGQNISQSQWQSFLRDDTLFVNTNSGQQDDVFLLDVNALMNNPLGPPQNGMIYCTKDLLVYNANQVPEGGLLIIALGNIYFRGDFNITNWQPCVAMSPKFFYFLSDDFNVNSLPHATKATLNHMEWPYEVGSPVQIGHYPPGQNYDPGYSNWYATQDANMPNKVQIKPNGEPYRYNVSLIGPYVFNPGPQYLERWKYYTIPGTGPSTIPPYQPPVLTSEVEQPIEFRGNFIVLPEDNFLPNYAYGGITQNTGTIIPFLPENANFTGDWDWPQERPGDNRNNPGWPENMTSVGPSGSAVKKYVYEDRYFDFVLNRGVPELPPDEGLSFRRGAWIETSDFNHHDIFISKIESDYLGPIIPDPQ